MREQRQLVLVRCEVASGRNQQDQSHARRDRDACNETGLAREGPPRAVRVPLDRR
jgi:hypothetical protein